MARQSSGYGLDLTTILISSLDDLDALIASKHSLPGTFCAGFVLAYSRKVDATSSGKRWRPTGHANA